MGDPLGYSKPTNCGYATDSGAFAQNRPLGSAMGEGVTADFFATIGVPFIAGSTFPQTTPPPGVVYAVINSALAARLWPREDPLQRALYVLYDSMDPKLPPVRLLVVGVVRDFQASGPMALVNDGIYTPFESFAFAPNTAYLVARGDTVPTVETISRAVHSIDPRISLFFTSTVGQQIDLMLSPVRLTTRLTIIFAFAAVLLCAVGVYSLTVSQVLQSSREFGIRMALGAEPFVLWRHFARGHFFAALAGVAIGLIAALQVSQLLRSLLFGVTSHSSEVLLGVAGVILAVTVLSCVPSLFRLKRINPADCLRSL
jgi:ABC-type antimicrobial peptide transport system permease subunit